MAVSLILGGARSGKSAFALRAAEAAAAKIGTSPILIATAEALDDEMRERIAAHRASRGPTWRVIEEPIAISAPIRECASGAPVVVDCLTLWISNLMMRDLSIADAVDALIGAIKETRCELWLIANEVGLGVVPDHPMGRRFRDEAGWINQRIAVEAECVTLMIAGLPLVLKAP